MSPDTLRSPGHASIRSFLRVAGPLTALAGIALIGVGLASFFASSGGFGPPPYFWCAFAGMPLLAAGGAMCKYGYMGDYLRYVAGESAPVARDAFNHIAEGAGPGLRAASRSVAQGLEEGRRGGPSEA